MAISLHVASALTAKAGTAGAASSKGGAVTGVDSASPFAALFGNLLADPALLGAQETSVQSGSAQAQSQDGQAEPGAEQPEADTASQSLVAALFLQQAAPAAPLPTVVDTGAEPASAGTGQSAASALALPLKTDAAVGETVKADGDAASATASDTPADGFAALLDTPASGESLPEPAANLAAQLDPVAASGRRIDVAALDLSTAPIQAAIGRAEAPAAAAPTTPSAPTQAAPAAQYAIAEPVGSGRWSEAISQRALFMVDQQVKTAELHLNPPHLGPMEIKLTLDGDKASLNFVTSQALVKEAVQQSLPRLQQVFADNGMAGLEVNIQLGQQSQPDHPSQQSSERRFTLEGEGDATDPIGSTGANALRGQGYSYARARGGVDIFA